MSMHTSFICMSLCPRRRSAESRGERLFQPALLLPPGLNRSSDGTLGKPHLAAWPDWSNAVHAGGDDVGDLGVSSGGLLIDKQDDWLPVLRYLDGAQRDSIGK